MKTIFLTSRLFTYDTDESGNKIPKNFGNANYILENFKKYTSNYDNFLYIASSEDDYVTNDIRSQIVFQSFDMTMPFSNYSMLDGRNIQEADVLIAKADFILLAGGHGPTQNQFFHNACLGDLLNAKEDGVICGVSAGSINIAYNAYIPPEEPGEAINPNYPRYYFGMELVDINIMPHYSTVKAELVDNINVYQEFILPDSYITPMYALEDGSYILLDGNTARIFGESYLIRNGKVTKIADNNECRDI